MSAIVNRRDIDFLLYEMLGLDSMLETPRYAGYDRASIEAVLDMAQQIAEEKFLPHAATVDAREPQIVDGRVDMIAEVGEALRAYAGAGLFGRGPLARATVRGDRRSGSAKRMSNAMTAAPSSVSLSTRAAMRSLGHGHWPNCRNEASSMSTTRTGIASKLRGTSR